jgi:superfamily II RNA helicase
MNIYLFPTDTNFTSRKSTAAKKVARKLAGFSKKTVTPPQQSEVKINYMPQQPKVLQAAALTTLATAPVAFQEALKSNWFKLSAGCEPDIFQKSAGINLIKGEDVLVTAPTGTGKTAIAHFAINKNLNQGVYRLNFLC